MPDKENYGRRKTDRIDANISRKYKGKEYSLIDIQNLIDANAQLAETIRNREKFIKQQEEILKNEGKLSHQQQVMYTSALEANKKAQEQLNQNDKRVTELTDNWNRYITDTMKNPSNSSDVMKSIIQQSNSNNKPMPKSISDLFRQSLTDVHNARQEKSVQNIYQNVAGNVTARYKRQGADFTDPEVIKKMNGEIQQETAKKASGALKKFSLGAELINVASNTFNAAVSKWTEIFNRGKTNQIRAYEDTFTNISVRNGVTRDQYTGVGGAQWKLNNVLSDMGLRNNIASSDVQRMWDTMATNGIKIDMSSEERRAEITERAINNVMTQTVVPQLKTGTAEFEILNDRLDGNFVKDIRGINKANMELAGNTYVVQDLIQEIIDQVQPMSDEAISNLAQGSAEFTAMVDKLTPYMGKEAAKSYATQIFKMQNYSDQIMRSGSTYEKMWLTDTMNSPYNLYDALDWNNIAGLGVDITQKAMSWTPDYTSTTNGIVTNSVLHSLGLQANQGMGASNLTKNGLTGSGLAAATDMTPEEYAAYKNAVEQSFTNDENQTQEKLQNITVENLMNELAVVNEWLGNWAGVIETAIKGIGAILLTKIVGGIIGKGIGLLSGVGGAAAGAGSGGLFAALGAAGPIALGVAAVGAGIAIGNAIAQKISQNQQEDKKEKEAGLTAEYLKSGKASNQASATLQAVSDASMETQSYQNEQLEKYGIKDSPQWFSGAETDIKYTLEDAQDKHNWEAYNQAKAFKIYGSTAFDKDFQKKALIAFAIALDHDDMLSGTFDKLGIQFNSAADIKSTIKDLGYTVTDVFAAFDGLMASDLDGYPADGKGGYTDLHQLRYSMNTVKKYFDLTPEEEELYRKIGYHRQGLDSVPIDNYPAILHQGEAVLTAATANELRNLLDEYRDTTQQTVNFDNIIRTQTQDLITKMDEIKQVMINSSSSIGNFTDTLQQTKAKEILYTSMKHVHSTKSF